MPPSSFSRRDFLKLGGLGLGAIALNPFKQPLKRISPLVTFPAGDRLGRIAVTPNFNSTELKAAPDENQPAIRSLQQDEIVVWLQEVVGTVSAGGTSKHW